VYTYIDTLTTLNCLEPPVLHCFQDIQGIGNISAHIDRDISAHIDRGGDALRGAEQA